jgi:hypothetical protein
MPRTSVTLFQILSKSRFYHVTFFGFTIVSLMDSSRVFSVDVGDAGALRKLR